MIGENATSRPAAKHFPRSRFFFICRARAVGADFRFFPSTFFLQTHVHPLPRSEFSARMQGGPPPLGAWVLTFAGKLLDRNLAVRVQSGSTFNLSCGRESPLLTSKWLKSGPGGGREAITILVCVPQSVQPFQALPKSKTVHEYTKCAEVNGDIMRGTSGDNFAMS